MIVEELSKGFIIPGHFNGERRTPNWIPGNYAETFIIKVNEREKSCNS